MKKFLLIIFTITLAYVTAYYTTDNPKKHGGDLFYKIKILFTGEVDTTSARSLQKEGNYFYDIEEYNRAIKYYRKAIDLDSNYQYLYYPVAESYLALKDTGKAINTLLNARYLDKDNNEILILLADIYLQKKDTTKAIKYLLESNEIYKTRNALESLSKIYLNKKQYQKAKYYNDKALNIFPDDVELLENQRKIFLALNMPDSARMTYNIIKSIDPDFFPDYSNLAEQAKNEGKTQEAINYYTLALQEEPDNSTYYDERGWLYIELQKYDSAYYDFYENIRLNPTSHLPYFSRAYVLDYMDSIHEAIRDYKISLKYKDDYKYTHNNLGYEYYRLKDFKNSEKYYTKSIEIDPDYNLAIYNRGILYFEYKKYRKALSDFKKALANSPNDINKIYYVAKTYDKLKNKRKALDYYNEYIRLSGDDIDSTDYNNVIKRIAELSAE